MPLIDLIVAAWDEVSGKNDGSQTWKVLTGRCRH
jgi:hypothetical protein